MMMLILKSTLYILSTILVQSDLGGDSFGHHSCMFPWFIYCLRQEDADL